VDYVYRSDHILLISPQFVEIRQARTGRLVQVIVGRDIRLLNAGILPNTPILMAKKGKKNDADGQSDEVLELVQTTELATNGHNASPTSREDLFDEWDL
jgi:hypothetical protein